MSLEKQFTELRNKISKKETLFSKENDTLSQNQTEVNNLPDKELKVIVIKMLTELGRIMNEHDENFNKDGKYTKVLNRSHRAKEYNSSIEKYIRKLYQHTG